MPRRALALSWLCLTAALLGACVPDEGSVARSLASKVVHRFLSEARPTATHRRTATHRAPARRQARPATALWAPIRPTETPQATVTPIPPPRHDAAPSATPFDFPGPSVSMWPTPALFATPTEPPTATPDVLAQAGVPVRLELPSIGVNAVIEQVGITRDRAMGVPSSWDRVGWYRLGYRPGDLGNAVIAGHLDTSSGGPAVFWDLERLVPGDEVIVTYSNGDRLVFIVQGSQVFDHDASGPIIEQIFGPALTANLNLITCDGAWDRGRATYTKRLVVFTTLAPDRTVRAAEPGAYE